MAVQRLLKKITKIKVLQKEISQAGERVKIQSDRPLGRAKRSGAQPSQQIARIFGCEAETSAFSNKTQPPAIGEWGKVEAIANL